MHGQNTIGLPDISNYSKQNYKAGAQNRQIRQDKKGVLYFANSEGVLTFDGINWKTYPVSNNSIVRAVEFGPDNKLYVGGIDTTQGVSTFNFSTWDGNIWEEVGGGIDGQIYMNSHA